MSTKDRDNQIGRKLAGLDAADIAPHWQQDAGWVRTRRNLERRQKRIFLLRSSGISAVAATIALLIGSAFLNQHKAQKAMRSNTTAGTSKTISPMITVVSANTAIPQAPVSSKPAGMRNVKHKARIPIAVPVVSVSLPDTSPTAQSPAVISPNIPIAQRAPATVYTLTEIMNGEPERIIPPAGKFSGIFHAKSAPPADASNGDPQLRRPRRDNMRETPSSIPDIIN